MLNGYPSIIHYESERESGELSERSTAAETELPETLDLGDEVESYTSGGGADALLTLAPAPAPAFELALAYGGGNASYGGSDDGENDDVSCVPASTRTRFPFPLIPSAFFTDSAPVAPSELQARLCSWSSTEPVELPALELMAAPDMRASRALTCDWELAITLSDMSVT